MKKTKKFISILLSLIMIIGITAGFSITTYGEDSTYVSGDYEYICGDNYFYYDDNTITITKYLGNDSIIIIPSTINGLTVKGIGPYTFKNCKNINSITLSETIENFYYNAFDGCTNLTQLIVDKNNKIFDSRNNCNAIINTKRNELSFGIQTTVIPDSLEKTGANSFYYLDSPEEVNIPFSVKFIGGYAFFGCNNLKKLRIAGSVEFVGMDAFSNCSNLQTVDISEGATAIGMFKNCKNLTNIVIPKSVFTLAADAFQGCESLKSITILNKELKYSQGDDNYWGMYDGLPKTTIIYGYKNSTAQRYAEEYNRSFIAIDEPIINSGTDTTYKKDSNNGVSIHCAYPLDCFIGVSVDGNMINNKNYTLSDGSTILTFNPSFLNTLSLGKHTVTMEYTIGTVSSKITIESADSNMSESKNSSEQTTQKASNIKLSATSYTYDGKVKTPSVTVKDSKGKTLRKNTDYTVSYASGRKNVGKYAVKITFKGNYSGTKTLYFTIKPKGTSLSKVTAAKKGFKVYWKKQSTQTTGYQIQYATNSKFSKAKTITLSKNSYTSKSISKLSAKKKYYVRVRTYKKVGNTNYYSSWSKAKYVTTKK